MLKWWDLVAGSGKTLAYLLPLLQNVAQQKRRLGPAARPNSPRGLIIVPARELADQIYVSVWVIIELEYIECLNLKLFGKFTVMS